MTTANPDYFSLKVEESWIEFLRTRLPYSFREMREAGKGRTGQFVLSEPVLINPPSHSRLHNYWTRGSVFYFASKLLDFAGLNNLLYAYRMAQMQFNDLQPHPQARQLAWSSRNVYNTMQTELVARQAYGNLLDRDRTVMAHVALAAELCLKAVLTHTNYKASGEFRFSRGHSIAKLFHDLPAGLRDALMEESKRFVRQYMEYQRKIEQMITDLDPSAADWYKYPDAENEAWRRVNRKMKENGYTTFIGGNDPSFADDEVPEDWLPVVLQRYKEIDDMGGIADYYRYVSNVRPDELSVDHVKAGLMFARFLYEHLFPVDWDDGPSQVLPWPGKP